MPDLIKMNAEYHKSFRDSWPQFVHFILSMFARINDFEKLDWHGNIVNATRNDVNWV
jgi:sorbitol-specific phosphotransferase system component IIC